MHTIRPGGSFLKRMLEIARRVSSTVLFHFAPASFTTVLESDQSPPNRYKNYTESSLKDLDSICTNINHIHEKLSSSISFPISEQTLNQVLKNFTKTFPRIWTSICSLFKLIYGVYFEKKQSPFTYFKVTKVVMRSAGTSYAGGFKKITWKELNNGL